MNAQIKSSYCCGATLNIMKGLIERFNINQEVVNIFEDIFECHAYTNLDWGSKYRDKNTRDFDIEKLLNKIFQVADLLENEVQEYFFECYLADAESQNKSSIGETDYLILKKKIEERRKSVPNKPKSVLNSEALKLLQYLNGKNMHGRKIMSDADFQRLKFYVETMIEQGRLPDRLEPISQVNFPNGHIRFLFRCIHAEQYAERKIQDHFIDFIHAVFPRFTGKKETTKHKFGEEPTTWKSDLEKMNGG